jgi:hypothetical protein
MSYTTKHNGGDNTGADWAAGETGAGGLSGKRAAARAGEGGAGGVADDGGGGFLYTGSRRAELLAKEEYPEPMVARTVGLSRSQLKALRDENLTREVDWVLVNAVVTYSPAGLEKLLRAAGLDAGDFAWPGREAMPAPALVAEEGAALAGDPVAATPAVPPLVELRVRNVCGNPILVFAATPEGEVVKVRVRTNTNFLPGMPIRARAPQSPGGLWHHEGACPRFRGKY